MADSTTNLHSHVFLGEGHERNERRTWTVIVLCAFMMVAEIAGGLLFGSIALVADGMHMSTHASALLLAALAYRYARRHATDARFTFGTGKLGDLAGFTSAIVLAMIALLIGWEAVSRIAEPVPIAFREALPIAGLGLAVNIASAWLLVARIFGWLWMDPLAGIIGAAVIASWAYGLVRDTGRILLDMNPDPRLTERLRAEIETDGDRLTDLHLWRLGPGHLGAVLSVVTGNDRRPEYYRQRLRQFPALSHVTVEVQSP